MKKKLLFRFVLFVLLLYNLGTGEAAEDKSFRPYQLAWELETSFSSVDMAPSGEFIVVSTGSEIKTLDVKTGKIIQSILYRCNFKCELTTNGYYIIINDYYEIINKKEKKIVVSVLNKTLNEIQSNKYDVNDNAVYHSPGISAISLSGKNIISSASKIVSADDDKPTVTNLYYFENNRLIWSKEFNQISGVTDISISSNGDSIGVGFQSATSGRFSKVLDMTGNIVKEFENVRRLKLSTNGRFALGLKKNKVIYFDINSDNNTIWEFGFNDEVTSYDQTYDSNLTVLGFVNSFNILNKQGNVIQEYNLGNVIKNVQISSDGKYLLIVMATKIAVFSNELVSMKFPEENSVIERLSPIFKWEDIGALKYLIKIDNDIFETSQPEFNINGSFPPGQHEWAVKAIYDNGIESIWTHPTQFYYFSEPVPHLTFPDEGKVFEEGNITFKWDYSENATKYLLNISGNVYESFNKEFTIPTGSFRHGLYRWSVKTVRQDGLSSNWSLPRTFSISAPKEKIVQKEVEVFSQPNIKIAMAASIFIIGVLTIFIRPYYKRLKVKRKMAKTATDWCPHCLKFTGGAIICPHCCKNTLSRIKYSEKSNKIKKE